MDSEDVEDDDERGNADDVEDKHGNPEYHKVDGPQKLEEWILFKGKESSRISGISGIWDIRDRETFKDLQKPSQLVNL